MFGYGYEIEGEVRGFKVGLVSIRVLGVMVIECRMLEVCL